MNKILHTAVCLGIGISIGLNMTDNVSITETRVHDGKYLDNVSQVEFYDSMIQNVNAIEIYDTSELTPQVMANRSGKIIVEKVIGKVTSNNLDGEILNCNVNDGGYGNKDGGNYTIETKSATFNIVIPGKVKFIDPITPNSNKANVVDSSEEIISKIDLTDEDLDIINQGKIKFTVNTNTAIQNLITDFTFVFSYSADGKLYETSKQISPFNL